VALAALNTMPLGERYDPLGRIIVGRGCGYSDVRRGSDLTVIRLSPITAIAPACRYSSS
jgi:hypothetical protein